MNRENLVVASRKKAFCGFRVSAAGVYRVIQIANKKPYVAISASRNEYDEEKNKELNRELLKLIKSFGLYAYEMIGGFEEEQEDGTSHHVIETSYFVPYNETKELNEFINFFAKLASEFDQDAILVGLPGAYDYGDWESNIKGLKPGAHYFISKDGSVEYVGTEAVIQTFDKYGSIALDPKKDRIIEWVIAGVTTPGLSNGCYMMKKAGLKWFADDFKKPSIDALSSSKRVRKALEKLIS